MCVCVCVFVEHFRRTRNAVFSYPAGRWRRGRVGFGTRLGGRGFSSIVAVLVANNRKGRVENIRFTRGHSNGTRRERRPNAKRGGESGRFPYTPIIYKTLAVLRRSARVRAR